MRVRVRFKVRMMARVRGRVRFGVRVRLFILEKRVSLFKYAEWYIGRRKPRIVSASVSCEFSRPCLPRSTPFYVLRFFTFYVFFPTNR